jgi:hypothetical protein
MTRRQTRSGRSGRSGATAIEWVGGTLTLPAYVTGEGEPYRPEALFWMTADGAVLGSTAVRPGELLPLASASLQSAIEQPIVGRPHAPTQVRVASAELADTLRAGYPEIEVVCAPTPELDELFALLRDTLGDEGATGQSYLSSGIEPEAMASLFKAAAALFRARPWKVVPDDQSLFSVTIEPLGVRDAALSVIGQMGESFGFILFSGLDDFEAFLDAAEVIALGDEPELPPHFAFSYERRADLAPELRKEIVDHHWEVAAPNAYPWLVAIDGDLVGRPPTVRELAMAEAVALALTRMLDEKKSLRAAWDGGEPVSRTFPIATHQGMIEVTLRAPFVRTPARYEASDDVLAGLAGLARADDEIDPNARTALEDELMRRFAASPEAAGLEDIHACRFVMDLAADYLGATIATLDSADLHEVLFELVPRKVSIDASEAGWIVAECRAFYGYLKRAYGLRQADACLRVLGGNAVEKLEAALADRSNFGMAKSLFMAGRDAGFDMQSPEGIEAWMRSIEGKPLPRSIPIPSPGAPKTAGKKAAKAKKGKRKAARQARKKNR